jgi:thymidylate kinase
VLDVTDAVAAARRPGPGDRLERAGAEFHAAVRQAYRDLAAERGWTVVDGTGTEDQVHELVWKAVAGGLDVES